MYSFGLVYLLKKKKNTNYSTLIQINNLFRYFTLYIFF